MIYLKTVFPKGFFTDADVHGRDLYAIERKIAGDTDADIGRILSLSRERVGQILKLSAVKIKRHINMLDKNAPVDVLRDVIPDSLLRDLRNAGYVTLIDVFKAPNSALLEFPGLGRQSVAKIRAELTRRGF